MLTVVSGFSLWQEVRIYALSVSELANLPGQVALEEHFFQLLKYKLKAYLLSKHDMPPSRAQQSKSASLSSVFRFFAVMCSRKWRTMHGSFLCLTCIIWHDMNWFCPSCQHDSCERDLCFSFFYIELCIVNFVFLPGSEYIKVRVFKGVVVNLLHVKILSALHNLRTVIHEHDYFQ